MKLSFSRYERIKSKIEFQTAFEEGQSITFFPVKIIFLPAKDKNMQTHKIGIAVSRRKIKKAVDRNLIKRRIREAYRKHKYLIKDIPPHLIIFNYLSPEINTYGNIEEKIILSLHRLKNDNCADE